MNVKDVILRMPRRADKGDEDILVKTFVNIGPLISILRGENNQVLYGRRGTGKTHVLRFLKSIIENENDDCCIFIDIRQIGSTGSLYSDKDIPVEQRATRLFTDILQEVRNQIVDYITKDDAHKELYLSNVTPLLYGLLDLLNNKRISGSVKVERQIQNTSKQANNNTLTLSEKPSFTHSTTLDDTNMVYEGILNDGHDVDYMDFSSVYQTLEAILREIMPHKIWILVDEFAELNTELQIALADMFRRVLCPLKNCVFKIAAIEHRSDFKQQTDSKNYYVTMNPFLFRNTLSPEI